VDNMIADDEAAAQRYFLENKDHVRAECLQVLENCRLEVEAGRITGVAVQGFCPRPGGSTFWIAAVGTVPVHVLEQLGGGLEPFPAGPLN
jgi:hypothetical protein